MWTAIVPAAGRSARMGRLKPLLPFGDRTVLETVVTALLESCVDEVVVVLGHRAAVIERTLADYPVTRTVNPDPEGDMLSSIQCGIRAARPDAALMIALGDQPLVSTALVNRLIDVFEGGSTGILIPAYKGKRGHPILLHARYRDDILALHGAGGLKELPAKYPGEVRITPVETDAVLIDLDYYPEYEKALERLEKD